MLSPDQVLMVYEAMGELSAQMLDAANDNDWDRVALLEQECATHVRTLRDNDINAQWSASSRAKKAHLIRQILNDDRHIRDLAMPWMARLSALMHNSRAQARLANTYGAV